MTKAKQKLIEKLEKSIAKKKELLASELWMVNTWWTDVIAKQKADPSEYASLEAMENQKVQAQNNVDEILKAIQELEAELNEIS